MYSYVNNGFFARDLDADDWEFIERLRERGSIAVGIVGDWAPDGSFGYGQNQGYAFEEEREFWENPWPVERYTVNRTAVVRPLLYAEKPEVVRARKEKRARDKALLATTLKAEREEWNRQQKERQLHQLQAVIDDHEWDRAAPKPKFGKVVNRHFIPQWKLDEERRKRLPQSKRAKAAKYELRTRRRLELERVREANAAAQTEDAREKLRQRWHAERVATAQTTVFVAKNIKEGLKRKIFAAMDAELRAVWTINALMLKTGTHEVYRELLIQCCREIIADGYCDRAAA
jgi:hypothetical protein